MSSEQALLGNGDADLSTTDPDETRPHATPEATSVRTLVWAAATNRPLEEVAALVALLKRNGDDYHSADEALRVAAVTRPVSEVGPLVALLNDPRTADSCHEALRAAAIGRSVEEVAELISLFGRTDDHSGSAESQDDDRSFPGGDPMAGTWAVPLQPEHAPPDPAGSAQATTQGQRVMWGTTTPYPTHPPQTTARSHHDRSDRGHVGASYRQDYNTGGVLRSTLRWPAAVALAACGLSHLPVGEAPGQDGGNGLSMTITVVYLLLAGWLAVRDTALAWTASATAAVGVIMLHALSRVGLVGPLRSVLGDADAWPEMLAVGLAVVSAALAAAALLWRPREVGVSPARA
ncbi:hypothetical protein [Streptomyces sp. NPDC017993]|uniref:hypothetical protein n=1 Tax=Streptomyces sp. NPDC017993 TaxID=3365027 RepID=UPI0037B718C2